MGYPWDLDEDSEDSLDTTLYIKKNSQNKNMYFFSRLSSKLTSIHFKKEEKEQLDKFLKEINSSHSIKRNWTDSDGGITMVYEMDELDDKALTCKGVPNGFYSVGYSQSTGYFLVESDQSSGDKYLKIDSGANALQDSVDKFYDNEDIYREMELKHKLGVLCYGPPGNSKTMNIREVIKNYKDKAVIVFIDDEFPKGLIKNLKHYDHNYIFIFEELTQLMSDPRDMANVLLFLDGEFSLDKQLTIATTNYPEHLPANLASRPGRFDKLIEVADPKASVRRSYLEQLTKEEISDEIVKLTDGMSIAYLREIVISSRINKIELTEAIKENKKRIKLVETAFAPERKSLGF